MNGKSVGWIDQHEDGRRHKGLRDTDKAFETYPLMGFSSKCEKKSTEMGLIRRKVSWVNQEVKEKEAHAFGMSEN